MDALRLAIGTLTRVPVRPPVRVDRSVARGAMLLAPVIGLLLGLVVAIPAQVLTNVTPTPGLLAAALAVAALAWLTRALHLDGLADTADGLGSGRPAAEALAIARRSDIGPFGVITLVLVLLLQVLALGDLLTRGAGGGSLVVAVVTGRLAITVACTRGIPAARPDGLGAAVAGSVPRIATVLLVVVWTAVAALSVLRAHGLDASLAVAAAVLGALLIGGLLVRTAVRRFGGVTGDVLGAVTEVATAAVLVILVVLPG